MSQVPAQIKHLSFGRQVREWLKVGDLAILLALGEPETKQKPAQAGEERTAPAMTSMMSPTGGRWVSVPGPGLAVVLYRCVPSFVWRALQPRGKGRSPWTHWSCGEFTAPGLKGQPKMSQSLALLSQRHWFPNRLTAKFLNELFREARIQDRWGNPREQSRPQRKLSPSDLPYSPSWPPTVPAFWSEEGVQWTEGCCKGKWLHPVPNPMSISQRISALQGSVHSKVWFSIWWPWIFNPGSGNHLTYFNQLKRTWWALIFLYKLKHKYEVDLMITEPHVPSLQKAHTGSHNSRSLLGELGCRAVETS